MPGKRKQTRGRKTTPYRNRFNGRGSLAFDHTFRHIGRIRRASGTQDRDRFREYLVILKRLHADPRKWPYLEDFRDGKIDMLSLYSLHLSGALWEDVDTRLLHPIHPVITDWVDGYQKWAPNTKQTNQISWRKFLEVIDGNTLIRDLPTVIDTYYNHCRQTDEPRKFNMCRSVISKYLNVTLGADSPIYRKWRATDKFSRARKKETHPLTVAELWRLIARLPKPHDGIAETLALCGLHLKELWIDGISVDTKYSIMIRGQKRTARHRRIPKLLDDPVITPPVHWEAFRKALNKHSEFLGRRTPKDLRGSFKWLLQASGIDPTRIDYYCGWNPQRKIGGLYSSHDYESFIKQDIQRINKEIHRQLEEAGLAVTVKHDGKDDDREQHEQED